MDETTVLVVDDVVATRMLLKKMLSSKGFTVYEAAKGAEVLPTLEEQPDIGLILLDIGLPDMDGYEVMHQISEIKEERGIKVCFVSGKKERDDIVKAIQCGGDDYIVKPIYLDALLAKVGTLLNRTDLESSYGEVRCVLKTKLMSSKIQPDLFIVGFSEGKMLLRSTASFEKNMKIEVGVDKIGKYLERSDPLTLSIHECKRVSHGKYILHCGYVGLSDESLQAIRGLAVRGDFLS